MVVHIVRPYGLYDILAHQSLHLGPKLLNNYHIWILTFSFNIQKDSVIHPLYPPAYQIHVSSTVTPVDKRHGAGQGKPGQPHACNIVVCSIVDLIERMTEQIERARHLAAARAQLDE